MRILFTALEQLLGYLWAVQDHGISYDTLADEDPELVKSLRESISLSVSRFTLEELMTIMPDEMQIGKDRCTSDTVVPFVMKLHDLAQRLPAAIRWKLELGFGNDGGAELVAAKPPVLVVVRSVFGIWKRLGEYGGCPTDSNRFIIWLGEFRPTETPNWSTVVSSFRTHYEKHRLDQDETPLQFLQRIVPHWDGVRQLSISDLRIDNPGLQNLLLKNILPGMQSIFRKLKLF